MSPQMPLWPILGGMLALAALFATLWLWSLVL